MFAATTTSARVASNSSNAIAPGPPGAPWPRRA